MSEYNGLSILIIIFSSSWMIGHALGTYLYWNWQWPWEKNYKVKVYTACSIYGKILELENNGSVAEKD